MVNVSSDISYKVIKGHKLKNSKSDSTQICTWSEFCGNSRTLEVTSPKFKLGLFILVMVKAN